MKELVESSDYLELNLKATSLTFHMSIAWFLNMKPHAYMFKMYSQTLPCFSTCKCEKNIQYLMFYTTNNHDDNASYGFKYFKVL